MLVWVVLAIITAAVLAVLLRPLLGSAAVTATPESAAGAVYRDQLAEIATERARGLIGEAEAEAARVEIARRLLAELREGGGGAAGRATVEMRSVRPVMLAIAGFVPIAAIALYVLHGSPGRPGQPFAERSRLPLVERSVAELVAQVEARLREHPEDGRGWDVIAPVYLRLQRYDDAARAFERALRLNGETAARLAGLAEASVLAANGIVTERARAAYVRLRELAPDRVEPVFWLALADEQDGNLEAALKGYSALLAEREADAPWRPLVTERWRTVRQRLGMPDAAPPAGVAKPTPATGAPSAPGPTPEDVEAAGRLSPEQRRQMIEDMVAGLDRRLRENGADVDGWARLIRAYAVLGRKDAATDALARARKALAGETAALERLALLARELGLAS